MGFGFGFGFWWGGERERNKKKGVCVESGDFYFWGGDTVRGTEIETEKETRG